MADLCRCGHTAGHHDDSTEDGEPACWDCDCEGWGVDHGDDQRRLEEGWWSLGTHPKQAPCLDCGGTFWKPPRCPKNEPGGAHRYPPFPGVTPID